MRKPGDNMEPERRMDEDDGRTIADMSGVEGPGLFRMRKPGSAPGSFRENGSSQGQSSQGRYLQNRSSQGDASEGDRPWEQPDVLTPQERRMYALGALKAALLIALAFIVGLGAVILAMIWIWV